jgi:hypothetical protein
MFLPIQAKLHCKGLSAKAAGGIVSNSEIQDQGLTYKIGQNSITGSTQPLYVIDGIPVSR